MVHNIPIRFPSSYPGYSRLPHSLDSIREFAYRTTTTMEAHEILGVSKHASEEQVRFAYKSLALKWHPDRQLDNREEATMKFAEINRANRTMLRNLRRARREAQEKENSIPSSSAPPSPRSTTTTLPESSKHFSVPHSNAPSQSRRSSQESSAKSFSSDEWSSPRSSTSDIDQNRGRATSRDRPEPKDPSSVGRKGSPTSSSKTSPSCSPRPSFTKLRKNSRPSPDTREDTQPLLQDPAKIVETLRPARAVFSGSGADVPRKWTHVLNMTLEEIYQGKTVHFRVVRYTRAGKKIILPLNVIVPAGSRGGTEIIIQGAGNECKDGSWQDIHFVIKEAKHHKFRRVHNDLYMDVRLPWIDSLNNQEGQVYLRGIDQKDYLFTIDYHSTRLLSGTAVIPGAGMLSRDGGGRRGRIVIRWEISSPSFTWDAIKSILRFRSRN